VPQSVVVRIGELGVRLPLEDGDWSRDAGQVAGYVPGGVGVVCGSEVRVLAHPLRIREGRLIP
jgi:hypothetical protein